MGSGGGVLAFVVEKVKIDNSNNTLEIKYFIVNEVLIP